MSKLIECPDLLEFSEKIRVHRKKNGMTQAQLAEKASMSDSTVQRLEGVQAKATIDTLFHLAKALGVTPNDLAPAHYGFTDSKSGLSSIDPKFRLLTDHNKAIVLTSLNAMVDGLLSQQY